MDSYLAVLWDFNVGSRGMMIDDTPFMFSRNQSALAMCLPLLAIVVVTVSYHWSCVSVCQWEEVPTLSW
jgi:hypothetical protein